LWNIASVRATLLLFVALCLAGFPACSSSKAVQKPKQAVSNSNAALISQGEVEVRARFGEPTVISKTDEGHILWVYRPSWKIIPNDNGTLYVEFADGKVIKIFKKQ
jgi:hypothetical protein